jgi:hypothetical protein
MGSGVYESSQEMAGEESAEFRLFVRFQSFLTQRRAAVEPNPESTTGLPTKVDLLVHRSHSPSLLLLKSAINIGVQVFILAEWLLKNIRARLSGFPQPEKP